MSGVSKLAGAKPKWISKAEFLHVQFKAGGGHFFLVPSTTPSNFRTRASQYPTFKIKFKANSQSGPFSSRRSFEVCRGVFDWVWEEYESSSKIKKTGAEFWGHKIPQCSTTYRKCFAWKCWCRIRGQHCSFLILQFWLSFNTQSLLKFLWPWL